MERPGCFGALLALLFAPVIVAAKALAYLAKHA